MSSYQALGVSSRSSCRNRPKNQAEFTRIPLVHIFIADFGVSVSFDSLLILLPTAIPTRPFAELWNQ